jgi:hypothetical protein
MCVWIKNHFRVTYERIGIGGVVSYDVWKRNRKRKSRVETKERKVESRTEQSRFLVQNSSASITPKIDTLTTDRVDRAEQNREEKEQNRAEQSREEQRTTKQSRAGAETE